MSEPALRLLDRDLPRMKNVFTPEFERRMAIRQRMKHRPYPAMILKLPPAPNVFRTKESKTRKVRNQRRELAAQAAAITAQTARLILDPLDRDRPVKAILLDVAREHGVSVEDIKSPCRAVFLVAVRHQAIARVYLAHHPQMSLPQIARAMGGLDHSSILHAVRKSGHWRPARSSTKRKRGRPPEREFA